MSQQLGPLPALLGLLYHPEPVAALETELEQKAAQLVWEGGVECISGGVNVLSNACWFVLL